MRIADAETGHLPIDNNPPDLIHSHAKLPHAAANVHLFSLLILTKKCEDARSRSKIVCGAVTRLQ